MAILTYLRAPKSDVDLLRYPQKTNFYDKDSLLWISTFNISVPFDWKSTKIRLVLVIIPKSLWVMAKILATSELEAKESGIFLHFVIFFCITRFCTPGSSPRESGHSCIRPHPRNQRRRRGPPASLVEPPTDGGCQRPLALRGACGRVHLPSLCQPAQAAPAGEPPAPSALRCRRRRRCRPLVSRRGGAADRVPRSPQRALQLGICGAWRRGGRCGE